MKRRCKVRDNESQCSLRDGRFGAKVEARYRAEADIRGSAGMTTWYLRSPVI